MLLMLVLVEQEGLVLLLALLSGRESTAAKIAPERLELKASYAGSLLSEARVLLGSASILPATNSTLLFSMHMACKQKRKDNVCQVRLCAFNAFIKLRKGPLQAS
eukprot:1161325-Pelagomonas_calceolata.AAC.6